MAKAADACGGSVPLSVSSLPFTKTLSGVAVSVAVRANGPASPVAQYPPAQGARFAVFFCWLSTRKLSASAASAGWASVLVMTNSVTQIERRFSRAGLLPASSHGATNVR
jgi:hypothetical protein